MCAQSTAPEDSATDLDAMLPSTSPPITPTMPWRVESVEALPNFRLKVRFRDGLTGQVDMTRLIHSADAGVFAALSESGRFAQARVQLGAVTWPGELDLAPDAMHAAIKESGIWVL